MYVHDVLWPDRAIGVMETLLVVDGMPVELGAHLDRLAESVRDVFGAELPAQAQTTTLERASQLGLGRLRLTIAPGSKRQLGVDVVSAVVDPADVFPSWERAIALRSLVVHEGLGNHKWADRAGLAWAETSEQGCLPLVLDAGGEVLEASRANIFAVEREVLITPAADGRILPGVARARAIEAAARLGIELREEVLSIDRLVEAGQAFLTNSIRGIEPVRSVDERELSAPGSVVSRLAEELKRIWIGSDAAQRLAAASRC
jgi:para-aminobenzoate synthetase / 4-amino-4-deoxychorismate lyase